MNKSDTTIKILIIEDDRDNLELMKRKINILNQDNNGAFYEVVDAGLTEMIGGALNKIRNHASDIILLDMNYGGKPDFTKSADGYRVAERLTEEERKKIICASGEPEKYETLLRPLGVRHFGGKYNFMDCILEKCRCNQK